MQKPAFIPQEVAYRDARGEWRRRTIRTRAAFVRFERSMDELQREWATRDEYTPVKCAESVTLSTSDDTNAYGFSGTHTTDAAW